LSREKTHYFDNGIAAIRIYGDKIQFRNPGASLLSMDQIIRGAETIPRNPIIARLFRLVGWAEIAGTGMLQMIENWQKAGFGKPVIRNNEPRYWFTIEFSTVEEDTSKSSVKSSVKIIELLKVDPEISASTIAAKLNISKRAVEKQLAKLKINGKIRRIGPAKGGYWEIVSD